MEIAALVVSGIAAAGAVLSWFASRKSARAAERSAQDAADLAKIERDRRHEEKQPDWIIKGSETSYDLVEFELLVRGPGDAYLLTVEVVDGSVVRAIRTLSDGDVSSQRLELGEVTIGVPARFFGNPVQETDRRQRFRATFTASEGEWMVYRECEISWAPRIY